MVDVITEITINKPVNIVADFATNPDNAPIWYVNIKSAEWKSPKPLVVGSRVAFVAHFLGRKLAYTYVFVELEEGVKVVMKTEEGPFPMETTYTWTALNATTTKMTLRNAGKPSGFSKFIAPLMAAMMRKANSKDLMNLKRIVESQ